MVFYKEAFILTHRANLFCRLGLAWLLLATIPSLLLLTQNQLFPLIDLHSTFARMLYWITTTGTAPLWRGDGLVCTGDSLSSYA